MAKRFWIIAAVAAAAFTARADTVFFKDGSQLDGRVSYPNPNAVKLTVKTGSMTFPVTDVQSVEENDKEGNYDLNKAYARKHNDWLQERTGLNREQREEVRKMVVLLASADEAVRERARQDLLAYNEHTSLFKYFESSLPYMRGHTGPDIMRLMVTVDPERSKQTLQVRVHDLAPRNRAEALRLTGQVMKEEGLETLAKGVKDHAPEVCIAAAAALADIGDKRASKVLLAGLDNQDRQVQNACGQALARIWANEAGTDAPDSPAEWKAFVQQRAVSVPDPLEPAALQPLIDPADEHFREYVDE